MFSTTKLLLFIDCSGKIRCSALLSSCYLLTVQGDGCQCSQRYPAAVCGSASECGVSGHHQSHRHLYTHMQLGKGLSGLQCYYGGKLQRFPGNPVHVCINHYVLIINYNGSPEIPYMCILIINYSDSPEIPYMCVLIIMN